MGRIRGQEKVIAKVWKKKEKNDAAAGAATARENDQCHTSGTKK
jgi:hypothetical protein